jgi:hypothetical protein
MPRLLLTTLAIFATIYLLICAAMFFGQRALIYLPQPRTMTPPATLRLLSDVELEISASPRPGPYALIYFGGNAEDVSLNLPDFLAAFPRHALYLMHYRGFADSGGRPSQEALQRDALALFDRVKSEHSCVAVIGRSLGSSIAVHLASERPVDRLVLVTPFDSLAEVAADTLPWLPVRWLLRDRYETYRDAASIATPTLLITAGRDRIVPPARSEALYRAFRPGVATQLKIPARGHNDIAWSPMYLPALRGGVCGSRVRGQIAQASAVRQGAQ